MKKYFIILFCICFLFSCNKKQKFDPSEEPNIDTMKIVETYLSNSFPYETSEEILKVMEQNEKEYIQKLQNECSTMSDSVFVDYMVQDFETHIFLLKKEIINRLAISNYICKELYNRNIKETNPTLYNYYVSYIKNLYDDYYHLSLGYMNNLKLGLEDYAKYDSTILNNINPSHQ